MVALACLRFAAVPGVGTAIASSASSDGTSTATAPVRFLDLVLMEDIGTVLDDRLLKSTPGCQPEINIYKIVICRCAIFLEEEIGVGVVGTASCFHIQILKKVLLRI